MSYGVFIASLIVAGLSGLCYVAQHTLFSGPPKHSNEDLSDITGGCFYLVMTIGLGFTSVVLLVVAGIMKLFGH